MVDYKLERKRTGILSAHAHDTYAPLSEQEPLFRKQTVYSDVTRTGLINTLSRTAGSLYRGFGSIQCCLGLAGDLTFCD